jgi:hypothetical protein
VSPAVTNEYKIYSNIIGSFIATLRIVRKELNSSRTNMARIKKQEKDLTIK